MTRPPRVATIDFETEEILPRPAYPPRPVGVAVRLPGQRRGRYYAWGHPTGNNSTLAQARAVLQDVWRSGAPILCHNGKFDLDVAETHLGLTLPPWHRVHDTTFLLFLHDPHSRTLALKPATEFYLDWPPEERDVVRDWLVNHGIVRKNQKDWGAHIAKAPGDVVSPYATGDVDRTHALFQMMYPKVFGAGMGPAYDVERELMPHLLQAERDGVRTDHRRVRSDLKVYEEALLRADAWLRRKLKAPELELDSDRQVGDAFDAAGVVTEWGYTAPTERHPGGQRRVAKGSLTPDKFTDQRVAQVYGYRQRLAKCLGDYLRPWAVCGGRVHPQWNQVRQPGYGTRTGRFSTTGVNLLAITKDYSDRDDGYVHPAFLRGLPPLPLVRRYLLPEPGHVWLRRDYNQQELRILAHYEQAALLKAYQDNPRLDVHEFVRQAMSDALGRTLDRRPVKTLNFGYIYGMGIGKLMWSLGVGKDVATELRNAQMGAVPGLKNLSDDIKTLSKMDEPIETWGGRLYYVEPPMQREGRRWTFEYKLLNYLIQGSAADCTKRALLRYWSTAKDGRYLAAVHDEVNVSAPRAVAKEEMEVLRKAMELPGFALPMLTDGEWGRSWGEMKKYKD